MAYRKTPSRSSSSRKHQLSQALPIWRATHTNAVNLAFMSTMERFGVTDVSSYLRQWRILIAISVIVCAGIGGVQDGLRGLLFGGVLGVFAPPVLLWLGVLLLGIVIFMAIYFITWAIVLWLMWWFVSGLFTF